MIRDMIYPKLQGEGEREIWPRESHIIRRSPLHEKNARIYICIFILCICNIYVKPGTYKLT